jgi:hypothetical protein
MWGELIDFVMMENIYQPDRTQPHLLLPRGKFSAWYRLGSAFQSRAPVWICPSINVPKQLAGEKRTEYYTLMFLEAYANNGRWGYYWWPGVDVETRVKATAPEKLKDYTRLLKDHRQYFEQISTQNTLAILYLNSSMRERPEGHFKYLALAQALSEAGYQYDVIYGGDGVYTTDALDWDQISRYKALLVPETGNLTTAQADMLARYAAEGGGQLVTYVEDPAWSRLPLGSIQDEAMLFRYWKDYRGEDRQEIVAGVSDLDSPIRTSNALVNVIRYTKGDETILHFLNYDYHASDDSVRPAENLAVRVPWEGDQAPRVRWVTLEGEQSLPASCVDRILSFKIPRLGLYGFAVLK